MPDNEQFSFFGIGLLLQKTMNFLPAFLQLNHLITYACSFGEILENYSTISPIPRDYPTLYGLFLLRHCYADDTQFYSVCEQSQTSELKRKVLLCIVHYIFRVM